ncbi:RNA polymerase sigma factor [Lentzea sp. NPDC059081]|uniref:RNA polymerase sigma factor n=1 Tax=Lentzea sp. NPDC059081 TaxID=3346719 RepID=UPI0036B46415
MTKPKERAIDGSRPDHSPDPGGADPAGTVAALFDTHAHPLRGYLAGRVGVDTADDLVAETFLVALRRLADYDPAQAPVRGWLYGIATNLLRNHVRRELRGYQATERLHAETGTEPGHAHDARVAAQVDAQRQLARALPRLSPQERDLLLLTSWAGLDPSEVATALNLPASTVRSRLHRVRTKVQAMLEGEES